MTAIVVTPTLLPKKNMVKLEIVDTLPKGMCYSSRIPTPSEVASLLDELPPKHRTKLLTKVMIATGSPLTSLLKMKCSNIHRECLVINHSSNTGEIMTRSIPISVGLQINLEDYCKANELASYDWLWVNKSTGKPIDRTPYLRSLQAGCNLAHIEWIPVRSYLRLIITLGLLLDISVQSLIEHTHLSNWNVIKSNNKVTGEEYETLKLWCDESPRYWFPWFLQLNNREVKNEQSTTTV
jgi:site-specific recombinase XerD